MKKNVLRFRFSQYVLLHRCLLEVTEQDAMEHRD